MLSPSDTSYRSLNPSPSGRELDEGYTPTLFELRFAEERTREAASCLGLLVLLKTFQCLGYFVRIADVPSSIVRCIAKSAGVQQVPDLTGYDHKTVRTSHMNLIRSWVGVSAFNQEARRAMLKACVDISRVREDLADIVNFAIEELIRQKYELPAFSALLRGARTARAAVNRGYYTRIAKALDPVVKQRINQLFERLPESRRTGWDVIKSEPRQPTVKEIRRFVEHMSWLRAQAGEGNPLAGVPAVKLDRFFAEGRSLNAARMSELTEHKRYAVAAAVLFHQRATAFDDGAQMLVRQMGKIGHSADEALKEAQAQSVQGATELVKTLRDVTLAYSAGGTSEQRLLAIGSSLLPNPDTLLKRCEEHVALNNGNFVHHMPDFFRNPRTALLLLLENLQLESTSQDTRLLKAIAFLAEHKSSRSQSLPVMQDETATDGTVSVGYGDPRTPDVSFSKQELPYGGWAFMFRHRVLGDLGRIVLQETADGRTHLSCEVAGDAQDPMTAERMAIFKPFALELSRRMEGSAGGLTTTNSSWTDPPPRPPEPKELIESKLIPVQSQ